MKTCNDLNTVRNLRCKRETGHDHLHRNGLVMWGSQDPWQPAWRRNMTFNRDLTGRVA